MTQHGIYKKAPLVWDVLNGAVLAYAQVFFSNNFFFGIFILVATFIYPAIGCCGLLAVLAGQCLAHAFRLSHAQIKDGYWNFNTLLAGLALGHYFDVNAYVLVLILPVAMLALFVTLWFHRQLATYQLPFLSLPFIVTVWIFLPVASKWPVLHLNTDGIYYLNYLYDWGGFPLVKAFQWLNEEAFPLMWTSYFKSLGAIFFQDNVLTGILIACGVLIFSRVAFMLTILGFLSAWFFYSAFGMGTDEFTVHHNAGNYIFTAVAIGGFFIIPSRISFLWVVFFTPIVCLILLGCRHVLGFFQLPAFSISFSLSVLLFLNFLHQRVWAKWLKVVSFQYFSPEVNLYKQHHALIRYQNAHYVQIALPFWGEWMVSQGYDGSITHLGNYAKALDFIVLDDELKSYQLPGTRAEDFYCFQKPVLAPASGWVTDVVSHVEENEIGGVNTLENWGNTIIIKHADGLYSKLSHLLKDAVKVKVGDYVYKGDIIAYCGNSGRSPEPHLHFQMQASPERDAPTLAYPFAYAWKWKHGKRQLLSYGVPEEGDFAANIEVNPILATAFYFPPGKKWKWEYKGEMVEWECFVDQSNKSYIYCHESEAYAYFINDGTMFYFTDYFGSKKALLYSFYRAFFKVMLAPVPDVVIEDELPLSEANVKVIRVLHDFTAPFCTWMKVKFALRWTTPIAMDTQQFEMESTMHAELFGRAVNQKVFKGSVSVRGIEEWYAATAMNEPDKVKLVPNG